jgi:hypothetical protein
MPHFYPGWQMHIWIDKFSINPETMRALRDWGAVLHDKEPKVKAWMFQRFLVHDLPNVDRYLVRDCDSRFTQRERVCVEDWERSCKLLHTIHDHPYHTGTIIMGGLWGYWKAGDPKPFNMLELVEKSGWSLDSSYGADQNFLSETIWPRTKHSCLQHGKDVQITTLNVKDPMSFCGEVIDGDGNPNLAHREMRRPK